jgi:hypothetical protein
MAKEFREGCLSLRYPDNWTMEREDGENGWTVALYSPRPATAFLTLTLDADYPDTDQMADTVLEAMRGEYPQLEADESAEQVAGRWAVGHDITFISLDLTNTCWTRSFDTPDGTALLMCQSADVDMPQQEPILRAICASLAVATEE